MGTASYIPLAITRRVDRERSILGTELEEPKQVARGEGRGRGVIVGAKLSTKGPCPLVGESDVSRENDLSRAVTRRNASFFYINPIKIK
jgi:hypothetical protein